MMRAPAFWSRARARPGPAARLLAPPQVERIGVEAAGEPSLAALDAEEARRRGGGDLDRPHGSRSGARDDDADRAVQCALDMQQAIAAQASDFVMPDVMKIGGVTGWLRAAALAQAKNIPMSNHLWPEISARLLCCTPTAHWLEYADWWNPILREPLQTENGMAMVENTVGSGVDWDEAAVSRFAA